MGGEHNLNTIPRNSIMEEKDIAGRATECIAEWMMRELGFFVIKIGQENEAEPIIQLKKFVQSCDGKCTFKESDCLEYVRHLPDFFIVKNNSSPRFLEVKFRYGGYIKNDHKRIFDFYPSCAVLVANMNFNKNPYEKVEDLYNNEEGLKNSRFHIWELSEKNDSSIKCNVVDLISWLSQKFDIKQEESSPIIKKYEKILEIWLRDEGKEITK